MTWCGGCSVRSTSRWAWCCSPGPRSSRRRISPCVPGTKWSSRRPVLASCVTWSKQSGRRRKADDVQAVRWHARSDVRAEVVPPPPPPGPGEVQLRVSWCGICGTDLEEWQDGPLFIPVGAPHPVTGARAPLVLGHEFAGVVTAAGEGVTEPAPGQRVAVDTIVYCGTCHWCRRGEVIRCPSLGALGLHADGGLAELCNAPARMCLPVPDSVADDEAAPAKPPPWRPTSPSNVRAPPRAAWPRCRAGRAADQRPDPAERRGERRPGAAAGRARETREDTCPAGGASVSTDRSALPGLAAERLSSAVVSDILDDLGHRDHVLDPAIRPLGDGAVIAGWANPFLVTEVDEIPAEPYTGEIAA